MAHFGQFPVVLASQKRLGENRSGYVLRARISAPVDAREFFFYDVSGISGRVWGLLFILLKLF